MTPEPAGLLVRALAPATETAPSSEDATSLRILDAALDLAVASGIRNLTMDDVARRAAVGRMTVYRRFGDKARLVEALAAREGARCLAELDAATQPDQPIEEQIAEGFVTSIRIAREHPLLRRLAQIEPESVLHALNADGGALFALARGYLAHRLRQAADAGRIAKDTDVDAAAELLVRVSMSFLLIEDSLLPLDDEERTRALARRLLAPMLA